MHSRPRSFGMLALALALLAAGPATARPILTAKSLACGGTGPQNGSISVSERRGMLTLRFRGADLFPGQAVTCGYTCGQVFTSGPVVACGTVGATGRFAGTIELPLATCFGFIPFFNTPNTGKCVPSTVP
ncbi:MAG TPA: hypothetical protein VFD92_12985 [Candidatus Binatia bacterium]|nr:hypothetical protein [Candidatus Binatia bacterium]